MAVLNNNALVGASGKKAGGYQISRSLRFNGTADSSYLSRTPASAGNRTIYTWSFWIKRWGLGEYHVFRATSDASNYTEVYFGSNDKLNFQNVVSGAQNTRLVTTQVFRDASAWYHFVIAINGSTSAKIYVNGTEITAYDTIVGPGSSNHQVNNTVSHTLGSGASTSYANFYLAECHLIDGQALTPSSFAETDATTGQWIPKLYSGSYGTNGFKLNFSDNSAATAAALGKDTSGNNNWTPNNLSVITGGPTSVAAASGALPIYNTTDTYGATKGTGTRTDSNSSSIVLALPMDGANGGTSFGDQSATIKGSGSAKTITVTNATTSTSLSKFYGSSGNFNGSSYLTTDLSSLDYGSNWTVEFWWYKSGTATGNHAHFLGGTVGGTQSYGPTWRDQGSNDWQFNINGTSTTFAQFNVNNYTNQWHHYAFVRNGGTLYYYVDGVLRGSSSVSFTGNWGTSTEIGRGGPGWSGQYVVGNVQDYRIYQGVKYTGNFNPPSSTADTTIAAGNDSLRDTPVSSGIDTGLGGEVTGNYCTLNPLDSPSGKTFSNGNLEVTSTSGNAYGTMAVSSGKWYWEVVSGGVQGEQIGIADVNAVVRESGSTGGWSYDQFQGRKVNNGSYTSYGASYGSGDVIGIALNMDAGEITFYKNGVSQGVAFNSGLSGKTIQPMVERASGYTMSWTCNFGQRPFAYPVSGFKALCDTNLTAPTIAKPNTVFDVKLWTGNGGTQTISGLEFDSDLIAIKCRNNGTSFIWQDSVRGMSNKLGSNGTWQENETNNLGAGDGYVSATSSTGFTVTNGSQTNENARTYAGWCWDAGTSTATNNNGSISSQVRANASAGVSIVTYTGNGSNTATVGHGLNAAPKIYIVKRRSSADYWVVYTTAIDGSSDFLYLNVTDAKIDDTFAAPTSTVFTPKHSTSGDFVAYCFAPVANYSSFGSYTGNGSSDGPFVFCNFRPRWIMVKASSTTGTWVIHDTARGSYNASTSVFYANDSMAEYTDPGMAVDINSNGFKVRTGTSSNTNSSSVTYLYCAFAESPFQYARAR